MSAMLDPGVRFPSSKAAELTRPTINPLALSPPTAYVASRCAIKFANLFVLTHLAFAATTSAARVVLVAAAMVFENTFTSSPAIMTSPILAHRPSDARLPAEWFIIPVKTGQADSLSSLRPDPARNPYHGAGSSAAQVAIRANEANTRCSHHGHFEHVERLSASDRA